MIRSAPYPAFRHLHLPRRARRYPRSGRRGLTALTAVLLLTGLLAAAAVNWQIAVANERIRGQARHLAEVVAAEGYGLHHWLHEERVVGTVTTPATPRALDAAELGRLAAHSATAAWRRSSSNREEVLLPRGWEIVHLVGRAQGEDLPDGILVLRPPGDLVNQPTWDATRRALDVVLGPSAVPTNLVRRALTNFRPDCDQAALDDANPACDRAYFASRFARLDTNAVLRQRHAGHPALPMETGIILGSNDLEGVGDLRAPPGRLPKITGICADDSTGTPCPGGSTKTLSATSLTIYGDISVGDKISITTTTAATGIFGEITGEEDPNAPGLTVNGCFRSVTPFVHGARC